MESKRPDSNFRDQKAIDLIDRINPDSTWMEKMQADQDDRMAIILRTQQFDRYAQDFISRNPEAVVVHLGCGLDSRFERVCAEQRDNRQVEWYDLDLPEVIALRRKMVGGEAERYHLLGISALDHSWMDKVSVHLPRPFLFLAEGVFMYLEPEQVRGLVLALHAYFPGAELVFDAYSPWIVRMNNRRFSRTKMDARYHWGMKDSREVENWGAGIHLIEVWYFLDHLDASSAHHRLLRHIPAMRKALGIYRFGL